MTATLPGPLIDIEVCLGVGNSENEGVWDSGTWDVASWGQSDTELGDWVDVTCSTLVGLALNAGASNVDGVVTRWEAATCALTLIGEQFDPTAGPYAGLLGPGTPVRVRWRVTGAADWLTAFTGYVDDQGFKYESKGKLVPTASIAATDPTRIFANFDGIEQNPIGQGESAAERVARIADLVGWPVDARDIEPGGVPVKSTTLASAAWSLLLQVADSDLGLLWLTRDGKLAYRPQGRVTPQRELAYVIGCDGDIVPVDIIGQQPTVTRNIVSISRQVNEGAPEAATVTLRDDASIARYQRHSYQRTDLIHTDDAWSTRIAEAVLTSSAWPSTAPERAELDTRADIGAGPLLLALEPSLSVGVSNNGRRWQCEPVGWKAQIYRSHIEGEIALADVSAWYGSGWDSAVWDHDRWGF